MFEKLSKGQIVLIAIIFVVLIGLLLLPVARIFNSQTAADYEPWDPDNEMVLKNSIAQLNQEGEQINQRLSLLAGYKSSLDEGYKILNKFTLDSPYNARLESIQPYMILNGLTRAYEGESYSPNISNVQIDNFLSDIDRKINSESQRYSNEYLHLLEELSLKPTYGSPSIFFRVGLMARSLKTSVFRKDSVKVYGDSILTPLQQPSLAKAMTYYIAGTSNLMQIVGSLDTVILDAIKTSQERRSVLQENLGKLRDDFNKKNFSINKYAVIVGIPFFILAALLMYWFGIHASNNVSKGQGAGTDDFKLGLSFTLNTITVLLLILSLLILGLSKVVQENTLAALLGAIAGYILNTGTDKSSASKGSAVGGQAGPVQQGNGGDKQ